MALRIDNLALANKKNLVGKSKLESELHRIDRERRADMRLLNNEKQRFKSKYSKFDSAFEHRGSEASDVIMYETHNPGFCYRRNGECRMPQSAIKNTSLGFEDIHVLIFTDEEVDIDKVLCLHLLSTHRTESLTPPPRSQRAAMFISRQQSPLERLVLRSKKRWPEDRLTKLLPIYVIDVKQTIYSKSDNLIRDGRLAARLIVNEKTNLLLRSVMTALEKSNTKLLEELITKSRDEYYLLAMLRTNKIQDFVKSLNCLNVISCCESFYLTSPFRIVPNDLKVRTPSGQIENLVRQIRTNIFKLPINCCWNEEFVNCSVYSDSETGSTPFESNYFSGEKEIYSQSLEDSIKRTLPQSLDSNLTDAGKNTSETITHGIKTRPKTPRYAILSRKRSPAPEITQESSTTSSSPKQGCCFAHIKTNMDFEKIANMLSKKANIAIKKDLANLEKTEFTEPDTFENEDPADKGKDVAKTPTFEINQIRQIKCPACCEKWKDPLPAPKTSHLFKFTKDSKDNENDLQKVATHSSHVISTLIDQELKFWNEYKISKKESSSSMPRFGYLSRHSFPRNHIIEIIDLDELDLAKVRQEIREHETKKKMLQFLNG